MTPKRAAAGPTVPVMIRMPKPLLKRLDAHVTRMVRSNPGVFVSRTDAIRSLLTKALDVAEKDHG